MLFLQTYKPPMYQDIPEELNVTLYQGDRNEGRGVLGSKATGEPAVHMGVSVGLAIRHALTAVQAEVNPDRSDWFQLGMFAIMLEDPIFSAFYNDYEFRNAQIYQNYIDYNLYFRCTSNTREDSISQWDHIS